MVTLPTLLPEPLLGLQLSLVSLEVSSAQKPHVSAVLQTHSCPPLRQAPPGASAPFLSLGVLLSQSLMSFKSLLKCHPLPSFNPVLLIVLLSRHHLLSHLVVHVYYILFVSCLYNETSLKAGIFIFCSLIHPE